MKQTLLYDQQSCRLQLEGLPDLSAGQGGTSLGIITGWSLEWLGRPQLEGRKEHLLALMGVVLPYARHLISGVARPFGGGELPVEIGPAEPGSHALLLRSSQPEVAPLELTLDDAELADLVRVLDQLRLDPRLALEMPVPEPRPLRARELMERVPLPQRLAAPVGGLAALAAAAGLASFWPQPRLPQQVQASVASPVKAPSSQTRPTATRPSQASLPQATPPQTSPIQASSKEAGSTVAPSTGASSTGASSTAAPSPPTAPARPTVPPPVLPAQGLQPAAAVDSLTLINRARTGLQGTSRAAGWPQLGSTQTWKLAVDGSGRVVAASPETTGSATDRAALGLPAASLGATPPAGTTLVRADARPEGFWELAPWNGW
jgi:hypothetical protein